MKKIVNFRLPVYLACVLCVGIGLGYIFHFFGYELTVLWILVPASLIFACFLYIAKRSWVPIFYIALTIIIILTGFFACYNKISDYRKTDFSANENYYITGTVAEITDYENRQSFILDNVFINGKDCGYKIFVNYYGNKQYLEEGFKISFNSSLKQNEIFAYGIFNYNAINNIKYGCSINNFTAEYRFDLFAVIRSDIRKTLYDNLDRDTASVCYAMLTGNTGNIDDGTLSSFRYGGVAHIFAVSGLHIGIIFVVLSFICKKCRMNKWVAMVICLALIVTYSGICGFTSSSLRAAVTCAVLSFAKNAFQKYDAFNSLAIAVLVLLFINPFYLFSVGFQLSVCAVGGICVFSKFIESLLKKIKIYEKICSVAGASFGAQIGVFPVMLSSFGYVSGAGLLLNIVIIPLLSIIFNIIFIGTVISCIIPAFAWFILPAAALPLELITSFLIDAGFENALIKGFGAGLFILLFFIGALFLSDKLNLKKSLRIAGTVSSVMVMISYVLISSLSPFTGCEIIISAYYNGGEVLIKSPTAKVLIVTEDTGTHAERTLNSYYCSNLDGIIILGGDDAVLTYYSLNADCRDLYLYMQPAVQPYEKTTVHYEKFFKIGDIDFTFEDNFSISFETEGVKTCVCAGEVPFTQADLLISEYSAPECRSPNKVYFHLSDYPLNVTEHGDLVYFANEGNILLKNKKRPYKDVFDN